MADMRITTASTRRAPVMCCTSSARSLDSWAERTRSTITPLHSSYNIEIFGCGVAAERLFLDEDVDLHADVLKVGHQGSPYSSSPKFIADVHPHYAIISVGRHNMFGHPALSRLRHSNASEPLSIALKKKRRRHDRDRWFWSFGGCLVTHYVQPFRGIYEIMCWLRAGVACVTRCGNCG